MIRNLVSFILRSRLENVIAAAVSLALLALFLTTRMFHSFTLGMHDFIFILLPISILGMKTLLGLLYSSEGENGDSAGLSQFFGSFFRPFLKIFRDWFPFLLLSACYYSLFSNLMLRINRQTADEFLSKIDAWVFGDQPAFLLEPMIRPWLTDFLNVIYFSFVLFLPGIALYFYVKKEEKAFRRLMMGYLTLILMGVASYLLVPAIGPEAYFIDRFTRNLQGQTLTQGVDFIMKAARVGHDCFPSLHVAIPLLLAFYLRDYRRKAFVPALVYVALMCCATIYLRYHYVVDVVAAFAYAPAAYWLNDFVLARWPGERIVDVPAQPKPAEPAGAVPSDPPPPDPDREVTKP